jgi:hypothetical protein
MLRRTAVQLAKDAKHQHLLLSRRLSPAASAVMDPAYRAIDRLLPYSYRDDAFPASFIAKSPKVNHARLLPAPSQLFVLWTGDNPMPPNRARALADIQERFEVNLITPRTLAPWVLAEAPFHPSYNHLSLVHRSDYLRAYLMHHYGGAYLDIKREYGDVPGALKLLNASPDLWMGGFRELGSDAVADEAGPTRRALRRHHGLLIGMCAFAARPGTPITREWLDEVHHRLDRFAPSLERHPGDALGRNPGYPIPWTGILGAVLQPLCLKYSERLLMDDRFRPSFQDYR